jgi:hypothetical protein
MGQARQMLVGEHIGVTIPSLSGTAGSEAGARHAGVRDDVLFVNEEQCYDR